MKKLIGLCLLSIIMGCSSGIIPSKEPQYDRHFVISGSNFEHVWKKAIVFLSEWSMSNIYFDKTNGIISYDNNIELSPEYADCGCYYSKYDNDTLYLANDFKYKYNYRFKIVIQENGDKVDVYFNSWYYVSKLFDNIYLDLTLLNTKCYPTGKFEKEFFDFVKK